jgi:hypothetical protein
VPKVSDADVDKVTDAIKNASFTVDVDENDVARKVTFKSGFDVPKGSDSGGVTGGTINFDYELTKVDGDVQIKTPTNAKPLSLLLQSLGLGAGMPGGGLKTQ